MVSPELLRLYPFFGLLDDAQLREIAMIAEETPFKNGEVVFREGDPAETLYFLLEGCIDLYFTLAGSEQAALEKGIPVGEINPGEPFGISALIEPHLLTATALTTGPGRMLKIDGAALRALIQKDRRMAYQLTHQAAKAAIDRLHATRIQLAAAWA
jgi:CRP/FNR family cyclic AMP-dependent transcriptional regulator